MREDEKIPRRVAYLLKFPWGNIRGDSGIVCLPWKATHCVTLVAVVLCWSLDPWISLLKALLTAQCAFVFAAFFLSDWPGLRYPKSVWELFYTRSAALFCLLLIMQAAFKFPAAQWLGRIFGALAAGRSFAPYSPTENAVVSIVLGLSIYILMWKSSKSFSESASMFDRRDQ